MSQQARQALVDSPNTIFQHDSQRSDLLNESLTQTDLIALLTEICITRGYPVEFTAVRSDHRNDSCLGLHSHADGYAADCWPLDSRTAGAYLDAGDPRFQAFLHDLSLSPWLWQIGLAGSADTAQNKAAGGPSVFSDEGADHVHLGAR